MITAEAAGLRLLLVEDTLALAQSLVRGLGEEGFDVHLCATVAAGRDMLARDTIDGVILDLGLPDDDGMTLLSEIRASGHTVPVLGADGTRRGRVAGAGARCRRRWTTCSSHLRSRSCLHACVR